HNNLGFALDGKGWRDEAIGHYEEALRINPKHAYAHSNLGDALYAKGWLDEAVTHYKEAPEINPNLAAASGNLGDAFLLLGRLAGAQDATRRCLGLLPKGHPQHTFTAQQLRLRERLLALEGQLPAILSGKKKPAGAAEGIAFGWICQVKKHYG